MDILMAFLAFSAVMIVLSTMATAIVEALHKLLRQRKKDFERMLSNYYEGSVKPLVKGAADIGAKRFVETIRRNPAFAGEHDKTNKSSGNYFFDTAFETLTTPHFVEQLARSDIGKNISAQVQSGEARLIDQLAAEFERYGDAAHDYFHRRAQVFSLFVAVIFAFVVNVDAVKLFQSMSADNELAKRVVAQIDPDEWEAKYIAAKKVAENDTQKLEDALISARKDLHSDLTVISKLDLPIGHTFFPFCADNGLLKGTPQQGQGAKANNHIDARCNALATNQTSNEASQLVVLLTSKDFCKWFFSTLLAGLLIGLGAPFWFKTYRFLADFVPGVNRGPTTETREALNNQRAPQVQATASRSANAQILAESQQPTDTTLVSNSSPNSLNTSKLTTLFRSASGVSVDNTADN